MAFDGTFFPILVAGPSDVEDALGIVNQAITAWNDSHAEEMGFMLVPRNWRTHSAPELGNDAQSILNRQLGDKCDAIIAVFDSRMGTKTPRAISGTAEEINRFVAAGKRVMVYFSDGPISRKGFSVEQFEAVEQFKGDMRAKGLLGDYSSPEVLRRQLDGHIARMAYHLRETLQQEDQRPRLSAARHALNMEVSANMRTLSRLWETIHQTNLGLEVARDELAPGIRLSRMPPPRWRTTIFEQQLPQIVDALGPEELEQVDRFYDRLAMFDDLKAQFSSFFTMAGNYNLDGANHLTWNRLNALMQEILHGGNPLDAVGMEGVE